MAYADIGKGLFKYLEPGAVVYAGYQYYADRGISGFMADIQNITMAGIQAKSNEIITGGLLIMGAPFVGKYVPNVTLRHIVKAVMLYMGASQLFAALRSGAGYGMGGGTARGFVRKQVVA